MVVLPYTPTVLKFHSRVGLTWVQRSSDNIDVQCGITGMSKAMCFISDLFIMEPVEGGCYCMCSKYLLFVTNMT